MANKEQEQVLKELRRSYQVCFSTKEGSQVLKDLELRTGIHTSTFDIDPYKSANLEGIIKSMLKQPQEKK